VDGRLAADFPARPQAVKDREIRFELKAGDHPVEFGANFSGGYELPEVFLTRPGTPIPEVF
jgi:hypothetical protein